MKQRSQRFATVQQHTAALLREATLALARAQEELRLQSERLEQLVAYRDEYGRDFRLHGDTSRNPGWLRNYQIFLRQLNDGIGQQQALVAEQRSRVARARASLEQINRRARALETTVTNLRRREHRAAERREQRQADDLTRRTPDPQAGH